MMLRMLCTWIWCSCSGNDALQKNKHSKDVDVPRPTHSASPVLKGSFITSLDSRAVSVIYLIGFFGVYEQELAGLSVASAIAEVLKKTSEIFMSEIIMKKIFL